jgi:hypothetical protein
MEQGWICQIKIIMLNYLLVESLHKCLYNFLIFSDNKSNTPNN